MSEFTGSLTLTELPLDWKEWRLEQELAYQAAGFSIVVPKGFETDGASVPRPLWWILPAWGRYSRAAVVHDYLCRLLDGGQVVPNVPDRKTADAIFYDAMVCCGVNTNVRFAMWAAVRLYAIFAGK